MIAKSGCRFSEKIMRLRGWLHTAGGGCVSRRVGPARDGLTSFHRMRQFFRSAAPQGADFTVQMTLT
jgi:hypothetical protein